MYALLFCMFVCVIAILNHSSLLNSILSFFNDTIFYNWIRFCVMSFDIFEYLLYISSSQAFSQTVSIESVSYQDSSDTTQVNPSTIKRERTRSVDSVASSIVSIKSHRKINNSNLSTYSKARETVVTLPFTIDSPVRSANINNLPDNHVLTRDESIYVRRRPSLPESLPKTSVEPLRRATPESVPKVSPVSLPKISPESLLRESTVSITKVSPESVPKVLPEPVRKVPPEIIKPEDKIINDQ